jgi:NADH-quinone oxidoreductase subunit C
MYIPEQKDPVEALQAAMPDVIESVKVFRDETTVIVAPENVVTVLSYFRDTTGLVYNFLSDISAVDYHPDYNRPARFGVSYHIYSLLYNRNLRIKTFVDEGETIPTATVVWLGANWLEREIMDLMGIQFEGHPDPRRILMPKDWDGHPHRRDYPLGYETIQFSFNIDEIMKHKPFAKE